MCIFCVGCPWDPVSIWLFSGDPSRCGVPPRQSARPSVDSQADCWTHPSQVWNRLLSHRSPSLPTQNGGDPTTTIQVYFNILVIGCYPLTIQSAILMSKSKQNLINPFSTSRFAGSACLQTGCTHCRTVMAGKVTKYMYKNYTIKVCNRHFRNYCWTYISACYNHQWWSTELKVQV